MLKGSTCVLLWGASAGTTGADLIFMQVDLLSETILAAQGFTALATVILVRVAP